MAPKDIRIEEAKAASIDAQLQLTTDEIARNRAGEASSARSFRVKVVVVWVVIFIVLGIFLGLAKFDWPWMKDNFKFIATGLWVTVFISACSIVCATILAIVGALGRLSRNPIAFGLTGFYTSFFRGTPLIVQIFLIYLGLAQIGTTPHVLPPAVGKYLVLAAVVAGITALSLNYGAYMTEIFRAGIQAVGGGQTEAADALGMTYIQKMRRVVLPQAFRIILPATGNEFIAMMKDSAQVGLIASTLLWYDIFKRANTAGNADFRNLEALIVAAGLYWALTSVFTFFQRKLERRVGRGYLRSSGLGQPGIPLH